MLTFLSTYQYKFVNRELYVRIRSGLRWKGVYRLRNNLDSAEKDKVGVFNSNLAFSFWIQDFLD